LYYQKRVIDASLWVNESIPEEVIQEVEEDGKGFLSSPGIFISLLAAFGAAFASERRETMIFHEKNAGRTEKLPL